MSGETLAPYLPLAEVSVYSILQPGARWARTPDSFELRRIRVQLFPRLPSIILCPPLRAGTDALPNAVRALLLASGYEVPRCRVVCDTAHASEPFDGETCSVLALPLAVAILRAGGVLDPRIDLEHTIYFGQWSPGGLTWVCPSSSSGGTSRDKQLALVADVAVEHSMAMVVPEDCLEAMAPVAGSFLKGATTLRQVAEQNCTLVLPGWAGEERKA